MTARSLFSMMFGSTVNDGGLPSLCGKTLMFEHSAQVTFSGAWIACFTSVRSKYTGGVCTWKKEPGKPRTSHRIGYCAPQQLARCETGEGVRRAHGVEDAVDVKRGVHEHRGVKDLLPELAAAVAFDALAGQRERALRWEGHEGVAVISVAARVRDGFDVGHEGIAVWQLAELITVERKCVLEGEDVLILLDEVHCRHLFLDDVPADRSCT